MLEISKYKRNQQKSYWIVHWYVNRKLWINHPILQQTLVQCSILITSKPIENFQLHIICPLHPPTNNYFVNFLCFEWDTLGAVTRNYFSLCKYIKIMIKCRLLSTALILSLFYMNSDSIDIAEIVYEKICLHFLPLKQSRKIIIYFVVYCTSTPSIDTNP